MPLYDYHCDKCGETFDEFRPMDKRHKAKCPKCSKMARKLPNVARLDYYNMGCDPDFTTCIDKWDKMHRAEAKREYD